MDFGFFFMHIKFYASRTSLDERFALIEHANVVIFFMYTSPNLNLAKLPILVTLNKILIFFK